MARNGAISIDFVITDGKDGLRRLTMYADALRRVDIAGYTPKQKTVQHETMAAHHHMVIERFALGYYKTGKYESADISVFCSTRFHGVHF